MDRQVHGPLDRAGPSFYFWVKSFGSAFHAVRVFKLFARPLIPGHIDEHSNLSHKLLLIQFNE